MRRTIDVVVPSYNYARYLEASVDSILTQNGVDVRVLIIDDASTDDTPAVGARLSANDQRVEYRRHSGNIGHIRTYNEGLLEWADAEYVLLISADDLLVPDALCRAVDALEQNPDAVLAHGRQVVFEYTPPVLPAAQPISDVGYSLVPGSAFIAASCSHGQNSIATPTAVVRTDAQRAVGGYEPRLPHSADLEMWLRLATRGSVIGLAADQAFKRHHGRNMQLAYLASREGDIRERLLAFEIFFQRCGADVGPMAQELARVRKALSVELFWRGVEAFEHGSATVADQMLQSAASIDHAIRTSAAWRRMAVKRMLGPRTWAFVHGLTRRVHELR